jgi:hypothetical protein
MHKFLRHAACSLLAFASITFVYAKGSLDAEQKAPMSSQEPSSASQTEGSSHGAPESEPKVLNLNFGGDVPIGDTKPGGYSFKMDIIALAGAIGTLLALLWKRRRGKTIKRLYGKTTKIRELRAFIGEAKDKSSVVVFAAKGRPRILIHVPPDGGEPSFQFFDASGQVIYSNPPEPNVKDV